jgi:hypothetical protein
MPKTRKPKPKKRGPKEERLVITEDPEQALARLIRPTTPPKPEIHGSDPPKHRAVKKR